MATRRRKGQGSDVAVHRSFPGFSFASSQKACQTHRNQHTRARSPFQITDSKEYESCAIHDGHLRAAPWGKRAGLRSRYWMPRAMRCRATAAQCVSAAQMQRRSCRQMPPFLTAQVALGSPLPYGSLMLRFLDRQRWRWCRRAGRPAPSARLAWQRLPSQQWLFARIAMVHESSMCQTGPIGKPHIQCAKQVALSICCETVTNTGIYVDLQILFAMH